MESSAVTHTMINAAKKAGRLLVRDFIEIERKQVSPRSIAAFVQTAEKRSEDIIIQSLRHIHPEYSILSEGKGEIIGPDTQNTWIIDPLDGTNNFSHSFPFFAISIALRRKNDIVAGIVYDPLHDHIYVAEKGRGAYCNNMRLRVSPLRQMKDGLIATSVNNPYYLLIAENSGSIRTMGAVSLMLAYLAAGHIDAYIEADRKIWDLAAGILLVGEAGGMVDDLYKKAHVLQTGSFIAGNSFIFNEVRKVLEQ